MHLNFEPGCFYLHLYAAVVIPWCYLPVDGLIIFQGVNFLKENSPLWSGTKQNSKVYLVSLLCEQNSLLFYTEHCFALLDSFPPVSRLKFSLNVSTVISRWYSPDQRSDDTTLITGISLPSSSWSFYRLCEAFLVFMLLHWTRRFEHQKWNNSTKGVRAGKLLC